MTTNERIAEILGYPPLAVVPPFETSLDACREFEIFLINEPWDWRDRAFEKYHRKLQLWSPDAYFIASPQKRCAAFLSVMESHKFAPQATEVAISNTKGEKQVGRSGV